MAFKLANLLILICSLTTAYANPNRAARALSILADSDCEVNRSPLNSSLNVSFELRTPCDNTKLVISNTKSLVSAPGFDVNKKTVVYVGGYKSDSDSKDLERLAKAYHCRNTENFIVVDPGNVLRGLYKNAAYNTQDLGRTIARGLINLGIPGKNIHLIGHSLGAHTMGMAARAFAAETNDKIGRVTGLDPARPCFIKNTVFGGLTSTDATFVDVIHTNPTEYGTEEPIGQVDFYPGGLLADKIGCFISICAHSKSILYYTYTVFPRKDQKFIASKCDSYSQLNKRVCAGAKATMGYAADPTASGIYLLKDRYVYKINPRRCGICTA